MLIVCPSCATTYQIELAALGAAGRSVRCASCKNTWFATPSEALATTAVATLRTSDAMPEPPAPSQPAADEFPEDFTGAFSVAGATPLENDAAPDDAMEVAFTQAPPIVPDDPPAESHIEPGVPAAIESIAARRARRAKATRADRPGLLRLIASPPMLIVALLAALAAVAHWRVSIVRHAPQTASLFEAVGMPVNLRGLVFENVKSTGEFQDGASVLVVEGTIVNVTPRTLEVPRLRFALRNSAGHEVYAWTSQPGKPTLGPGVGLAFRTRLASPPSDGREVIVRFFNRRDVTAGLQ